MFPLKIKDLGFLLNQHKQSEKNVLGACIDSRNAQPGDLFFALPGARQDGHAFLQDAAARGTVAAIVSNEYEGCDYGMELLKVPNVLFALHELARASLSYHHPKIVGITGSLGKTTTKEFVAALLRIRYLVNASAGNANTKLTLPLTILNRKGKEEILVLEMGMTQEGEIATLVQVTPPDIAVITTVALVHACNFRDLEHIARSKAEIFSHPRTQLGVYNAKMPFAQIAEDCGKFRKIAFAMHDRGEEYALEYSEKLVSVFHVNKQVLSVHWELPGLHNLQNYLAALTVAHQMGLSWEEIKKGTEDLALPPMRLQRVEKKGVTFINDAYNANQDSMCAALESLPAPEKGKRRIAVLGDMRELGQFSEESHKAVAERSLQCVDCLFCLGEGGEILVNKWKEENRPAELFKNRSDLIEKLRSETEKGDVVLLKGSKVHSLWLVIDEF